MTAEVGWRVKLPILIASMVFSTFLWVFVQVAQPRGAQVFPVTEVIPINKPDKFTEPLLIGPVMARADGPEEELREVERLVNRKQVFALVDLTNAQPGRQRYPLRLQAPRDLPITFSLAQTNILVELDIRAEREFPVTVEIAGRLPEAQGLLLSGTAVTPERVVIEGPEAEVQKVAKVRTVLDLSTLDPDSEVTGVLEAVGEAGRTISEVRITPLTVRIRPRLTPMPGLKTVLVEPVFVGQPPPGFKVKSWSVTPNQIALRGPSASLAGLWTVKTNPIDISGSKGSRSMAVDLQMPKGVTSYTARKVTVEIVVEPNGGAGG